MRVLTFDIGGANTKKMVVDFQSGKMSSEIVYFPVWKKKAMLKSFLQNLRERADYTAVTMTAELCDCFSTKVEGVNYIIEACEYAFEDPFYLSIDKKLLKFEEIKNPCTIAGANFVASVYFLEEKFGEGILIDIGSTTSDIVPFRKGKTLYGKTDIERLQKNQLVYTGVLRTPIAAITDKVPYKSKLINISSEYFAITADVYNVLGEIKDYPCETPDSRGKSKKDSMRRIARTLCADLEEIGKKEVLEICRYIRRRQIEKIIEALEKVAGKYRINKAYISGTGKNLGMEACNNLSIHPTETHENLPCLGLAYMVREHVRS